jgi:hypothetical protein
MWVTKDQIKTDNAIVVTPIYQSSNGFVVPDENSSFAIMKGQLDSIAGSAVDGGLRRGFVKYRIGGMNVDKWSAIDIADFDTAIHEASNSVHGRKDGIYFAGEKIYKIQKTPVSSEDAEEGDNGLTNMAEYTRTRAPKRKGSYKWGYYYDEYTSVEYRCRWCPDDDATDYDAFAVGLGKNDPIFNQKSLDAIAKKACEILASMGNGDFIDATECSAEIVSPEDVVKELMASIESEEEDVIIGVSSGAVAV